jgi:hypothetical protein
MIEIAPDTDDAYPRITPWTPEHDPTPFPLPYAWDCEPPATDRILGRVRGALPGGAVPRGAVNLRDYRLPSAKGWGAGWPSCSGAVGNLVIVTAERSKVRLSIHRRISILFDLLLDTMEQRGYLLKAGQCWGHACRPISGTQRPSHHSWALAGDLNAVDNPFTSSGQHSMPLWVPRQIFNPYGFGWGGDYSGARKDYMHVEFLGSPTQADEMTRKARADLAGKPVSRVLRPETPPMKGEDVTRVQKVIRAWYGLPADWVDGVYGPATVAYVRRVQEGTPPQPRLTPDGIVGPLTLKKLGLR